MSQMRNATDDEITQLIEHLEATPVQSGVEKINGGARVHVATVNAATIGGWQTIFGDLGGVKPVDSQRFAVRDVLRIIETTENADCIKMRIKIQDITSLLTTNKLNDKRIVLFKGSADCYICDGNHRAVAAFQVADDNQIKIMFTVYIIDSENCGCSR